MSTRNSNTPLRTRLLAAAASVAIATTMGAGVAAYTGQPALADAVRVTAPQVPSFADVVEKVSPAVVSVRVKSDIQPASNDGFSFGMPGMPGFDQLPDDHPLKRFFRDFGGGRKAPAEPQGKNRKPHLRPTSQGSGFFISADGYLVTNNHVVSDGAAFTVVMDNGDELDAKLVGTDPRTDLAVLKVDDDREFTYVDFADDSKVRVGDWVVAVGNPFGLGGSVTAGIISARGRDIGAGPYDDFIQIDAAVNRGNSGGPAFNLEGQVIGINTAIFSPSGGNVGIAFAIPSSIAKQVVMDLIDDGQIERGWLGVQIQPVTKDIAESLGLAEASGALVSEPQDDSPAKKAGLKAGDIITAVNDEKVDTPRDLARRIGGMQPGTKVAVQVWRNGESMSMEVTLGLLPKPDQLAGTPAPSTPGEPASLDGFGLKVTRADDGRGVVVTDVEPGSDAEERGIQAGDVIVAVNSTPVSDAKAIEAIVEDAAKAGRKAVLLQVERNSTNRFVALPVTRG
ncbi:MAG: DegQ family serine endoprotease [Notoacmeibacter sp.]|nr:DegQ family serine endoprotease [Notoacmeibacter sp.]